jgi:hypothetical protein
MGAILGKTEEMKSVTEFIEISGIHVDPYLCSMARFLLCTIVDPLR